MNRYQAILANKDSRANALRSFYQLVNIVAKVKMPAEIRYEFVIDAYKLFEELFDYKMPAKLMDLLHSYALQDDTCSLATGVHANSPKLEYGFHSYLETQRGGRFLIGVDGKKQLNTKMVGSYDSWDVDLTNDVNEEELHDIKIILTQLDIPKRSYDWYTLNKFGGYTSAELGEVYGVTESYVRRIIRGVWAKIDTEN